MKLVYDMVNGEFIDNGYKPEEDYSTDSNQAYNIQAYEPNEFETELQLQPVALETENSKAPTHRQITLPADLALQTFLMTK